MINQCAIRKNGGSFPDGRGRAGAVVASGGAQESREHRGGPAERTGNKDVDFKLRNGQALDEKTQA